MRRTANPLRHRTELAAHIPQERSTRGTMMSVPTVETARYLASQVMRLRRGAHQPRLSTAEKKRGKVLLCVWRHHPSKRQRATRALPRRQCRCRQGDPLQGGVVALGGPRLPFPTPRRR
ncbi:hypothetical protein TcCL_NonESM07754 [Trypanosoma cruzi]|nr:hypothetical protein TcCL_NonESM07754 [Trypanosoma cruzi]